MPEVFTPSLDDEKKPDRENEVNGNDSKGPSEYGDLRDMYEEHLDRGGLESDFFIAAKPAGKDDLPDQNDVPDSVKQILSTVEGHTLSEVEERGLLDIISIANKKKPLPPDAQLQFLKVPKK